MGVPEVQILSVVLVNSAMNFPISTNLSEFVVVSAQFLVQEHVWRIPSAF